MKQQPSFKPPSHNSDGEINVKFKVFLSGQNDAFNTTHNKTIKIYDVKKQLDATHQTSPNLYSLLGLGKYIAWNKPTKKNGDFDEEELEKMRIIQTIHSEIESVETREKRIKQSLIGDAF